MRIDFGLPAAAPGAPPAVATIGNLDGVHRGHRALVDPVVERAAVLGAEPVVVTFDPHPRCVLDPEHCPPSLTTLDEKRDLLAAMGVHRLCVVEFTRAVSAWSAEEFCDRLLAALPLRLLVVGYDFALGHRRQGDVAFLRDYGSRHGFEVVEVNAVEDGDQPVSSSRVRAALHDGDVTAAARLLGRPYHLDSLVEHGDKVGSRIGFPTANLAITPGKCLPARGVYATWMRVHGRWYMAATNIGYRPTFGGDRLTVEPYILDFGGDIYGEAVRCVFVQRLRDEHAYPTVDALTEQIARDVEETRRILAATPAPNAAV